MHAEDTHKKGGFFAKIFGHHDDPATNATDPANVIQPGDAAAAGLGDPSASTGMPSPIPGATPVVPIEGSSEDETLRLHEISEKHDTASSQTSLSASDSEINTDTMKAMLSDVHAVAKDDSSPLDLSNHAIEPLKSTEVTDDPTVPADEMKSESKSDDISTESSDPEEASPKGADSEADDMAILKAAQAKAKEDSLRSGVEPAASKDEKVAEAVAAGMTAIESPAKVEARELDKEGFAPTNTTEDDIKNERSQADLDTFNPPAPPVEEGLAWTAEQSKAMGEESDLPAGAAEESDPVVPSASESTTASLSEGNQAVLKDAQGDLDAILAHRDASVITHPEESPEVILSNETHTDAAMQDAKPHITAMSAPMIDDDVASMLPEKATMPTAPATSPETQAAVARLEQHIDDLETGLQKVRSELKAMQSK